MARSMTSAKTSFWEAYQRFREEYDLGELAIDPGRSTETFVTDRPEGSSPGDTPLSPRHEYDLRAHEIEPAPNPFAQTMAIQD